MEVVGLDLHLNAWGSYRIKISVSEGDLATSKGPWKLLHDSEIHSNGPMRKSSTMLADFHSLKMKAGIDYTFRVTSTEEPELVMTDKNGLNGVVVFYSDVFQVRSGQAMSLRDQDAYDGYAFNGSIQYNLSEQQIRRGNCNDSQGLVKINDAVGEKSCDWLSRNRRRYGYVCDFAEPAMFCSKTCGLCDGQFSKLPYS